MSVQFPAPEPGRAARSGLVPKSSHAGAISGEDLLAVSPEATGGPCQPGPVHGVWPRARRCWSDLLAWPLLSALASGRRTQSVRGAPRFAASDQTTGPEDDRATKAPPAPVGQRHGRVWRRVSQEVSRGAVRGASGPAFRPAGLTLNRETLGPFKRLVPVLSCGVAILILARLVPLSTFGAALATVEGIAPALWATALLGTLASFWAIGRAEAAVHEIAATGVGAIAARRAGWRAVALAQGVGFGPITSGFARARALPGLGPWVLARLTATATLGFVVALALLLTGVVVARAPQGGGAALALGAVGLVLARRLVPLPGLPGLRGGTALRLLVWTACDTIAAAAVLWLFLPGNLPFGALYAAYLLALGAGLLSQSPGGLGAFELALLTLLPAVPPSDVLAAALAYRVVYQVLPALLAGALLLRGTRCDARGDANGLLPAPPQARLRALHRSGQADWGLVHQGAEILLTPDQESGWLARTTPTSLVAIAQPLGPAALRPLARAARSRGLSPLVYKCDGRTAAAAQGLGWRVVAIAREAIIHPAYWSPDGPDKRQLRRKLKGATQEGIVIEAAHDTLPLAEMALVSALWAARHGGERGFSMGRFSPALIQRQVVMIARQHDRIIGFVTFQRARNEWALDLIRYTDAAPSGTTQALITAAIARAREAGVARLSLSACPVPHRWLPVAWQGRSLHQFKQSFAPSWVTRYAAAPGYLSLASGLASVALAVRWPGPLAPAAPGPGPSNGSHAPPQQSLYTATRPAGDH